MYESVLEYRHGEYFANKYPEANLMTKYLDHLLYILLQQVCKWSF